MHADVQARDALHLFVDDFVHHAVPGDLTHPLERVADDLHLEVRLGARIALTGIPNVSSVHGAFVDDVERHRRECGRELLTYSIVDWSTDVHGGTGGFGAPRPVGLHARSRRRCRSRGSDARRCDGRGRCEACEHVPPRRKVRLRKRRRAGRLVSSVASAVVRVRTCAVEHILSRGVGAIDGSVQKI